MDELNQLAEQLRVIEKEIKEAVAGVPDVVLLALDLSIKGKSTYGQLLDPNYGQIVDDLTAKYDEYQEVYMEMYNGMDMLSKMQGWEPVEANLNWLQKFAYEQEKQFSAFKQWTDQNVKKS